MGRWLALSVALKCTVGLRPLVLPIALVCSLVVASVGYAQAPSGSTGQCKDGTYTSATSQRGACSSHGGVKDWYGTGNRTNAPSQSGAPGWARNASPAKNPVGTPTAAGGGVGKVWVNTSTHVYHCRNDQWYGKPNEAPTCQSQTR